MGRDLTIYPKTASKSDLYNHLTKMGFEKCEHFWDWPEGTINLSWFDSEDHKCVTGVSADIYPIEEDVPNAESKWAVHVRNTYSASWHDVWMLNNVLRTIRKNFGGTIRGDYGTNRYAPLWDDESTPMSRGISAVYQNVKQNLGAIRHSIPDSSMQNLDHENEDPLIQFTLLHDPSRVIYNGLIPFAVAMFEYFYAETFKVLIKYDPESLERRKLYKQKYDFQDLEGALNGETTLEDLIARNYTFQNLEQLNKAYKFWLGIDVRGILYKKRKTGSTIKFLEKRIAEIIQHRHGIVHRFEIDRTLNKKKFLGIIDAVEKCIEETVAYLEGKYSFTIEEY